MLVKVQLAGHLKSVEQIAFISASGTMRWVKHAEICQCRPNTVLVLRFRAIVADRVGGICEPRRNKVEVTTRLAGAWR